MDTKVILEAIKSSSGAQMAKFDELSATVSTQLSQLKDDVATVIKRADKHDSDIDFLKRRMNDIEQEKLAADIEITGVAKSEIDKNQQNLKKFVCELIGSFGIDYDRRVVQEVFVRNVEKVNMSVIVVKLSSVDAKVHILKTKRASSDKRKIFFDHRLTGLNRALFTTARRVTREAGWKTFISGGKVFAARDNEKHRVSSFADIEKFSSQTNVSMVTDDGKTSTDLA